MKPILIILSYIAVIIATYIITTKTNSYNNTELDLLHKQNDSLCKSLEISSLKLVKLDSLTLTLKNEIDITKKELSSLEIKSKKIKQQYDAQTNRINNLSNTAVISEFTEAFE